MPWKQETTMSLKEEFIRKALAEEKPFSCLCKEFGITRKTGYHLLHRYQEEGLNGLLPRSKRPLSSKDKTSGALEESICNVRVKYPTWGPRKILKFLSNQGMKKLPAKSTVGEILKRNGFINIEESLKRKKLIRFERESPNDLWQMDFKGKFQLLTKETCYPLTILDDHSRFSLNIKACKNERFLPVKQQLLYIFRKYGLPLQINVDNGSPWGNSKLLRHTALTVWLMRLGIRISHSRPRHPQTNGKCERFHRTLKEDIISRLPLRSFSHAQHVFNKWRHHYNHERPHEALNMDVPGSHYRASKIIMPEKLPPIEYGSEAVLRRVRGNGYISYKNNEYLVGEAFKESYIEVKEDSIEKSIHIHFGKFKIYTYEHGN